MRSLIILALVTACVSSVAAAPAKPKAPALTIREITFFDDGQARVRLAANGNLELVVRRVFAQNSTLENRFAGRLAADGSFADAHGTLAGKLESDGTFRTNENVAMFRLVGDTLIVGNQHLAIDDNGHFLENGKAAASSIRIEGARDIASRRTALLVFAIAKTLSLENATSDRRDEQDQ